MAVTNKFTEINGDLQIICFFNYVFPLERFWNLAKMENNNETIAIFSETTHGQVRCVKNACQVLASELSTFKGSYIKHLFTGIDHFSVS